MSDQNTNKLTHTVFFKFKAQVGSDEKTTFREAAMKLANIPGVQDLTYVKQVSQKNNFEFGLTMTFKDNDVFKAYIEHDEHTVFVENYWLNYIEDFMEIDYHE